MSADYEVPLASLPFNAVLRMDYNWRSDVRWGVGQGNVTVPKSLEKAYGLLNASIGIKGKNDRYTVTAYGRNLTDHFYTNGISVSAATTSHTVLPEYKTLWGLRLDYTF